MKQIIAIFVFIGLAASAHSGTTGKITGRVIDAATKEPLPGANVILQGTSLGAAADAEGRYTILNIPPGIYTVRCTMIGYKIAEYTSVQVRIDLTTTLGIQLTPTVIESKETITIVAERPLVQKDITSSLAVVSQEEIRALPVQELSEVLALQAGITQDAAGQLHFRGGRTGEVAYLIDGISVTDPFSRQSVLQVENNSVQELVAVSGTFNAEYGQALSGVVDIATREGGERWHGELNVYAGDYVSSDKKIFMNIDDLDAAAVRNVQATLSGPAPGLGKRFTFFLSGRYFYNDGWLYGQRRFLPQDSSSFEAPNPADWHIEESGDGAMVPMNWQRRYSGHGKLAFRIAPHLKLAYTLLAEDLDFQNYNHPFKLNPEGNLKRFENGQTHILALTHALSPEIFYEARGSFFQKDARFFVYENPLDRRYVNPQLLRRIGSSFHTGGTLMQHFRRQTQTGSAKFELTGQIHPAHQIKTGFEFRLHELELRDITIRLDRDTGWKPFVDSDTTFNHYHYRRTPREFSAYLQDKIEWQSMIVNAGVRFDLFDPKGEVPQDLRNPRSSGRAGASRKYQLSPRLGIAYPLTDRGVIHASYGHFFQMPAFDFLYQNAEFKIFPGRLASKIGNANLEPERTIGYEIGLRQQLGEEIAIDVTGFYKDIRNLLGTEIHELYTLGDKYARYINRDYGNVRGLTFTLNNRATSLVNFSIDYTLQVAEGNASDPDAVFLDNQTDPPLESEKRVVPLAWDRTHVLNFQIGLQRPPKWGINLLGKLWSGLPYTPDAQGAQLLPFENSARRPAEMTFDLRAFRRLNLPGLRVAVNMNVDNLFDRRNELIVYGDTGRAGYTLAVNPARGPNTVEEFLIRPDFYSPPRQVTAGVTVEF